MWDPRAFGAAGVGKVIVLGFFFRSLWRYANMSLSMKRNASVNLYSCQLLLYASSKVLWGRLGCPTQAFCVALTKY